ncbi:DUF2207 domain-containing protein [Oceanobacillus sp. Castelsardo]|uniref:DUF2207 domain-containing protein n=1 Tax=Oceanobacillus sp. Castelsardo TaxID=1851204 RepID=UPI0008383E6B|nr:DUF2207 domain-containing protein [Oceanobacillus sp. Castelsardo]
MKKTIGFLFILMVTLLFPLQVLAVDFSIDQSDIHAYLKENGNVQVVETHTYEFDGKFNGITRNLIPKDGTSITSFKATENGSPLKVKQEEGNYKIYRSGKNEVITIELSYLIEDGIEVYSDMAQFYWPFFDTSNESDYENLTIYVHPPQETDDVIALGYDEAEGTEHMENNGTVMFQMGLVDSGEKGDIRVAYDRKLFPATTVHHDSPLRETLLAEKQAMIEKQIAFENRKESLRMIAPYLFTAFTLYLLAVLFFAWRKRQNINLEAQRKNTFHSFVPKQIMSMPATIYFYRNHSIPHAEMLTVGLMDLVRKGNVQKKKEDEYRLVNPMTNHHHEDHLIHLLFDKVGKNSVFSFKQLDSYVNKNQENFQSQIMHWLTLIKEEVHSHKLTEKKLKLRWLNGIIGFFCIPLIIILLIHEVFMWGFFFALLMVVLFIFAIAYRPMTIKGHIIKNQWIQLKEKFEKTTASTWNTWSDDDKERALIFWTGINENKLKEKNKSFIYTMDDSFSSPTNMFLLLAISSSASTSFNSATEISAQSSSVTPCTGTGVGGGGGGSGAF